MTSPIRLRFAPSPTGYLHIGGARTALFNWLYVRQVGGTFVLRMEDTDHERNTDAARETIFRGMDWLGFTPDEGPEQGGDYGPYSQSERQNLYVEHAEKLKETGTVYPCFCSKDRLAELRQTQKDTKQTTRYDQACRNLDTDEAAKRIADGAEPTWRLKVPEDRDYVVKDLVRGDVTVKSKDIEDIILIRSTGIPIYNFAVVVDDYLMKISHVVRGEDHLTNTFKQLVIYEALGWDVPIFAHLPLILGPTGQGKLSKRKHPEAALELYQQKGYPTHGLVNWLALVGWSFDDKTEVMTVDELIERFSFDRVNSAGARLPLEKLDWICGDYIRRMTQEEVIAGIRPHLAKAGWIGEELSEQDEAKLKLIANAEQERLRYFGQITEIAEWVFNGKIEMEKKALKNLRKEGAADLLEAYAPVLLAGDFSDPSSLEAEARAWVETQEVGFGKIVHPLRAAITRKTSGPGLYDCAQLLGADECKARIESALAEARTPVE
ncbi:MAG: nondiscriminating glutamyl-tRNA synthetase [Planctomycetota bacterium]|jgi:nondiscriminating glutamyl-tRNA synthetase